MTNNAKKVIKDLQKFLYLSNKIDKHEWSSKDLYEFMCLYEKYRLILK